MALLREIEDNFAKLEKYDLLNQQEQFVIKFNHSNNSYELFVHKDLDYIYLKSKDASTDLINTKLIEKKKIASVLKLLKDYSSFKSTSKRVIDDKFGLYRNREVFNKGNCNFENLLKKLNSSNLKSELSLSSVPKDLLYSRKYLNEILVNEIKAVNSNKEHAHYILPTDDDYTFMMYINIPGEKEDCLTINLLISFDPELYPFYPPSIKYVSPTAKCSLIYQMSNLDILQLENWNPVINMDWMITNLASNLNNLKSDYILCKHQEEITDLDKNIIEFSTLIGEKLYQEVKIDLQYTKFSVSGSSGDKTNNKYWKSGVGYGYSGRDEWDIKKFVKEQELKDKNIEKCLDKINQDLESNLNINSVVKSPLLKFVNNNICNSTLLEINKKIRLFGKVLNLLKIIYTGLDEDFNEWKFKIHQSLEILRQDITPLLTNVSEEERLNGYVEIISIADFVKDNSNFEDHIKISISNKPETLEDKEEYFNIVKEEQSKIFSDYKITSKHRFNKYKDEPLNPKSMMRISSEFSSLRKNLPNNWDTSIVVRASSDNLNIFSFVITGPKDTPYHNGMYEFHAYFPKNYPEVEPKVLLDTTGNSSVRFNPNLYNCGKVCLSLLGTWSGQDGESWNKSTSTFLQVLVSIQSLILVEQPYFNEPGWERQMHTEEGKRRSFDYNDTIRLENLRWAIVDKMRNPPSGFEELTRRHFELKKNEILEVTQKWVDETKKYKKEMTNCRNELLKLYEENDKSNNSSPRDSMDVDSDCEEILKKF